MWQVKITSKLGENFMINKDTACNTNSEGKKKVVLTRKKKRLIFYVLLLSVPLFLHTLFGLFVNINTFILAFQKSTRPDLTQGYITSFAGLENLSFSFDFFTSNLDLVKNSVILYGCNLVIVLGLALVFSYYIAKNFFAAKFFRVVLYLPSIISSVVLVVLYKYICVDVFKVVALNFISKEELVAANLQNGLLGNNAPTNVKFITVLFYNLWVGFGTNVMIFTGTMSSVDPSLVESSQLDGANIVREFIHIYIPAIWPVFITFVVTGMTGVFTNSMNLITFYGESGNPPFSVFGYFMYRETLSSDTVTDGTRMNYSQLAALGVIFTLILIPITLCVRKLMEKFGPRND